MIITNTLEVVGVSNENLAPIQAEQQAAEVVQQEQTGGKRRRRKVLANEDESALPEWAMRQRCGPIYICVPDTKGPQPCPKSVKTCPAGMKRVFEPTYANNLWLRGKRRGSKRRGRRGRNLLAEDEYIVRGNNKRQEN